MSGSDPKAEKLTLLGAAVGMLTIARAQALLRAEGFRVEDHRNVEDLPPPEAPWKVHAFKGPYVGDEWLVWCPCHKAWTFHPTPAAALKQASDIVSGRGCGA